MKLVTETFKVQIKSVVKVQDTRFKSINIEENNYLRSKDTVEPRLPGQSMKRRPPLAPLDNVSSVSTVSYETQAQLWPC